ncbi:7 transmembrane receptor (rhodopsin family) [Popillia japonica]|uniref:7 transmembrane receptor (Rhodopsin family) n=1 Tax=Popillia japonica TaxID=7064 RepID=A0AAW1N0L5_POPJA
MCNLIGEYVQSSIALLQHLKVGWRITVQWLAGNFACKVFLFLRAFGLYLSSNVLVCVSLDRYFAVLHPLRVNDARRRGKVMLAFAWGLSLLCAVPQSIVFHVSSHPKYPFFHQCVSFGLLSQKQEVAYTFFGVFAMYFLPLIVIVVAYTAIMCEIFHKSRDSREPQANNGRMRLRRSDMTNIERARTRTLKMTIMIVVVFVWCWTPYVVMTLWYMFDWDSAAKVPTSLQDALFMMAVSNSCMNPLVYGSYAIKFPKNCCRCICCCKCQTEASLNTGSTVTRSTAINGGNRSTIVKKCNLLSAKDEKHCMNRPSSIGHISFLSERPTNRSFRSSTFHSDPSPFTGNRKHDVAHHHHSSTHPSSPKEVI